MSKYLGCPPRSTNNEPKTTLGDVDINGDCDLESGGAYKIGGTSVLSSNTLGNGVVSSSLTSIGTQSVGVNVSSGQTYKVNSTDVLSATTLGSGVVSSSLTRLGDLSSLTVTGTITSFTSMPTLTSSHVGYTALYSKTTTQSNITSGTTYAVNDSFSLPVGVWLIQVQAYFANTNAGSTTITNIQIGFNSSVAQPTFTSSVTGFRGVTQTGSWVLDTGVASTYIKPFFSCVLRVDSTINTFYGVVQATWSNSSGTAVLNLYKDSYVQVTRLV